MMHSFSAGRRAPFLSLLLLFAVLVSCVTAGPSNRTIDDQKGDSATGAVPVRAPVGGWSLGPCETCFVKPDPSLAFDHTWLDATVAAGDVRNITLSFTGTAIYVFGIVPNAVPDATTTVNVTFTLDGVPAKPFFHAPDSNSTILYNTSMFVQEGLQNVPHKLVMTPTGGSVSSLFLFDYAIYTFDDTAPSSTGSHTSTPTSSIPLPTKSTPSSPNPQHRSSLPIAAIIGVIVGIIVALALALLIFLLCRRRKRPHAADRIEHVEDRRVIDLRSPTGTVRAAGLLTTIPSAVPANTGPPQTTQTPAALPAPAHSMSEKAAMAMERAERQRQFVRVLPPVPTPTSNIEGESSGGRPSLYPPSLPPMQGNGSDSPHEVVLLSRVKALEAEVNYLRGAAPPAYEGARVDKSLLAEAAKRRTMTVHN